MQCPSCQFENMPGLTRCGRCAGVLATGEVQIDVQPPRAGARRKRLRRRLSALPAARERLGRLSEKLAGGVIPDWRMPDVPESSLLWRMIVPGWAQHFCGHRLRGHLFFWTYLLLAVAGVLTFGMGLGPLLIGAALACHALSILDMVLIEGSTAWERLGTGLATMAILLGGLYVPLWLVGNRVARPLVMQLNAAPFAAGDVLLVNDWHTPLPGDIVAYEIPFHLHRYNDPTRGNTVIQFQGLRVDRILAGPGQTLRIDKDRYTVDGQPTTHRPLDPHRFPSVLTLKAGPGEWLILPSADIYMNAEILPTVARVPQSEVTGRVWLRSHPLSRFGRVY